MFGIPHAKQTVSEMVKEVWPFVGATTRLPFGIVEHR